MALLSLVDTSPSGADLQVLTSVLVFLLAVPFTAQQMLADEDLRETISRYRSGLIYIHVVVIVLLLALAISGLFLPNGLLLVSIRQSDQATWPVYVGDVALSILLLLTVVGIATSWLLLRAYRRKSLWRLLENRSLKTIRRGGRLDRESLADIQHLGANGDAGIPKSLALQTLARLTSTTLEGSSYRGASLEELMLAVEATVAGRAIPGNAENFSEAIAIFDGAAQGLRRQGLILTSDMGSVLRALTRIGQRGLELGHDVTVIRALDTVHSLARPVPGIWLQVAEFVFELGVAAVQAEANRFAIATLTRMENLVTSQSLLATQTFVSYLGLLGHFWSAGSAFREQARRSLANLSIAPPLGLRLAAAQAHYSQFARFDTADKIGQMLSDLRNESYELLRCRACAGPCEFAPVPQRPAPSRAVSLKSWIKRRLHPRGDLDVWIERRLLARRG